MPQSLLQACVPVLLVLLVLVAVWFALSPRLQVQQRQARISKRLFCLAVAPLIGFYDVVFGPGVGSFYMLACVILPGQHLMGAVCTSKRLNAACKLGALSVFALGGAIVWPLALSMAEAIVGAQLGARCAVRFGPGLIKPLLVLVCGIMAVKLLSTTGNPLGERLKSLPS